jgi:hypothetical protein
VIAGNTMENHLAVVDAFVQGLGTGKDVMLGGNSMGMVSGGKTGVGGILLGPVVEEGVFHSQSVGSKNMEYVIASNIALFDAIWSQHFFVFITGMHSNPYINVTAH